MKEKIVKIIQDKLDEVEYESVQTRMSEEYYMKLDAKIEVLEEILRTIEEIN